jgi:uncharacterized lipoprotein YehR (DUF1307 family)
MFGSNVYTQEEATLFEKKDNEDYVNVTAEEVSTKVTQNVASETVEVDFEEVSSDSLYD